MSGLGYIVNGLHETLSQKVSSSLLSATSYQSGSLVLTEIAKRKYQWLEIGPHSTKRLEGLAKELQVKPTG